MGDLLIALVVLAACAFLNRFAGGGWPGHLWDEHRPDKLWGRALYLAALGMGLAALLAGHGWSAALAVGLAFLAWRSPAWGLLISLGRPSGASGRKPHWFEGFLLGASAGSVHVALLARHLFLIIPGLVAIGWAAQSTFVLALALPFAVLATLAYEIAWRVTPREPIRTAEIIVGALWGALILIA